MKIPGKILAAVCLVVFAALIFFYVRGDEKGIREGTTVESGAVPSDPDTSKPMTITQRPMIPPGATPAIMLPPKTTLENLQEAYKNESGVNARLLEFARKADEEGHGKIADLFRDAARAGQERSELHAGMIKKMGGSPAPDTETPVAGSTVQNLQDAMNEAAYGYMTMYPEFVARAEEDKNEEAATAFRDAEKAQVVCAGLFRKALEEIPLAQKK